MTFRFQNFSVSKLLGLENLVSIKVSKSVSKKFGTGKSIGIGFENFWYRKKYWYRYLKKIGIEKSIGIGIGKNWYGKKYRIRYKKIGIGKKFWIGFV